MTITKEKFKEVLEKLQRITLSNDKTLAEMNRLFGGWDGEISNNFYRLEDLFMNFLESAHPLDQDNGWVAWFVWETGYGQTNTKVKDGDIEYKINSIEAFVDFLWEGKHDTAN